MELTTINGDDPRVGEFFVLARMANAYLNNDLNTDRFVTPVAVVGCKDLLFQEVGADHTAYLTYDAMFEQVFAFTEFPSRDGLQQFVKAQGRRLA